MADKPTCPICCYTEDDAKLHGDHHLCKNDGNAPWQQSPAVRGAMRRFNDALSVKNLQRENAELRKLCAEIYQVCGVLKAPANVLDQLSAASSSRPLPHKTLLPFDADPSAGLRAKIELNESQRNAAIEAERRDAAKALMAIAGVIPTPVEGYGTNSSWAISDMCRAVKELRAKLEAAEADTRRLEFLTSCLNEMDFLCEFVNKWHPTKQTTQRRGTDAEWRRDIDAAMGAQRGGKL